MFHSVPVWGMKTTALPGDRSPKNIPRRAAFFCGWVEWLLCCLSLSRIHNWGVMSGELYFCKLIQLIAATYTVKIGSTFTWIVTKPVTSPSKLTVYLSLRSPWSVNIIFYSSRVSAPPFGTGWRELVRLLTCVTGETASTWRHTNPTQSQSFVQILNMLYQLSDFWIHSR